MKANKLMIGDWVEWDGKPHKIEFVYAYNVGNEEVLVTGVSTDEIRDSDTGVYFDILQIEANKYSKNIQPIPLTGKILEKNGFNNRHRKWQWKKKDNYCRIKVSFAPKLDLYGEKFDDPPILLQIDGATFNLSISIEYVHELQHALKLCGIEKEMTI